MFSITYICSVASSEVMVFSVSIMFSKATSSGAESCSLDLLSVVVCDPGAGWRYYSTHLPRSKTGDRCRRIECNLRIPSVSFDSRVFPQPMPRR